MEKGGNKMNAIEINGLCKKYTDFELDNISFQVPSGAIMGFVGENGAGKTTTIKAMLNLIKKDSGNIQILGMDSEQYEKEWKEQTGIVFDENCFPEVMNAKEIEKLMEQIYKKWDSLLYEKYLKEFEIDSKKIIQNYSKGMKMKLSIAVALAHHAQLLILDEATSGLDPIVREEILDIFRDFIQDENHTVLLSSHIISDLDKIADYITFIHKGKLIFCKDKEELLQQYKILKCSKEELKSIEQSHIVAVRENSFGVEALIDNGRDFKNSTHVVDDSTLEDIILLTVKGKSVE